MRRKALLQDWAILDSRSHPFSQQMQPKKISRDYEKATHALPANAAVPHSPGRDTPPMFP